MSAHLDWVRDALRSYQRIPGHLPQLGDDIDHLAHAGRELKPAAVLIALVARPEPSLLFTKRNAALRTHPGQVAFPGGRIDAGEDSIAAALREAHEETALPPHEVEVVGPIDDYATGTGFRVTPVIGIIRPGIPLVPAVEEVESVFEVPLAHLLDPANHEKRTGEWQGRTRSYYVIPWHQHDIWGATAGMVVNFARIIGGRS